MKQYLMDKGLSENRILMEDQSTNTRENLIFSAQLIPDNASVGIVSNGFHICRALHLAKVLGYKNAAGIPAKSDLITQPANLLPGILCSYKRFLAAALNFQCSFLSFQCHQKALCHRQILIIGFIKVSIRQFCQLRLNGSVQEWEDSSLQQAWSRPLSPKILNSFSTVGQTT